MPLTIESREKARASAPPSRHTPLIVTCHSRLDMLTTVCGAIVSTNILLAHPELEFQEFALRMGCKVYNGTAATGNACHKVDGRQQHMSFPGHVGPSRKSAVDFVAKRPRG